MWCSYPKATMHSDVDCSAWPANRLSGIAHFARVRPPRVSGFWSSWDRSVQEDFDEKLCTSFSAREVQPAAKPAEVHLEKTKRVRQFNPAPTDGALALGDLFRLLSLACLCRIGS